MQAFFYAFLVFNWLTMKPMTRSPVLTYLNGYSPDLKAQVQSLLDQEKTGAWLTRRYPTVHDFTGAKPLYDYAKATPADGQRETTCACGLKLEKR
jgi:hypothetical protein